jgi:hypothetical protein
MQPKYTKVRARSENEGSGTVRWSLAAPVPACFLVDKEDIPVLFCQSNLSQCGRDRFDAESARAVLVNAGKGTAQ